MRGRKAGQVSGVSASAEAAPSRLLNEIEVTQ